MTRRRRGLIGALVGAVALVLTTATAAGAEETTTSVATPPQLESGLSLVSQSPWVALRQTFTMRLHLDKPALAAKPGAAIAVTVYQSASSRSGFDDVIKNQNLGGTFYVPDKVSVSSLSPDAAGNVSIRFGLTGSNVEPLIRINRPGVYPVKVELVNTGVASGSFVTWLVAVDTSGPKPIDKKLSVVLVWHAAADPITLPSGTDDPKVVAEFKPGGRLDKIANLLSHTDNFPMTLAVSPETVEAWNRLAKHDRKIADSFRYVRDAATSDTTEVLASPYVPIDEAVVDAAGLGNYLPSEYRKGSRVLLSAFGTNPASATQSSFIDPARTSDTVVNDLRTTLIDRVAVREQALIPVTHPFSPAEAFVLDTTGGDSRAVATAPFVEDLLNGPDPAALRAERVIAALAEIAYERPAIPRGIVIAPSARWNPDLKTMLTIVSALRTLPLTQPVTLDELFTTISNEKSLGANVQRRLVPATPAAPPVDPAEYESTARELSAYRAVVGARDPVVVRGEAALLAALSTSITPDRVHAALAQIDQAVRSFSDGVRADEKRITLTSKEAAVPLTFENNLRPARPVKVRIHLESAKLVFPDGDQIKTLEPGSNTIRFNVTARASGTFPMTISVTSPDGRLAFGAPVRVTVRSAVFGGWAVWLTVAALIFLAGWWANHFRRTRRNRRLDAGTDSGAGPAPVPAPTA